MAERLFKTLLGWNGVEQEDKQSSHHAKVNVKFICQGHPAPKLLLIFHEHFDKRL